MQRVIKFRAFDAESNRIFFPEWLNNEDNCKPFSDGCYNNPEPIFSNCLLMQFTGLTDKNGTEIFEGDILDVCNGSINGREWKDKPYAVEYKPKGFDICMFCWDDSGASIMDITHWCEVIGNIYQNPELLNGSD